MFAGSSKRSLGEQKHLPTLGGSSCGLAEALPAVMATRDGLQPLTVRLRHGELGAPLPGGSSAMELHQGQGAVGPARRSSPVDGEIISSPCV